MIAVAVGATLVLLPSLARAAARNQVGVALTSSLANARPPDFLCDKILPDDARASSGCDDSALCYLVRVRTNLAGGWTQSVPLKGAEDILSAFENGTAAWCSNQKQQAVALWSPYAHTFADHWTTEGLNALSAKDLDTAQQWFEVALALEPSAKTYDGLGHLAEARGDLNLALREYDAALALDPTRADTYFSAGYAAIRLGEFARAQAYCEHALMLKQNEWWVWQVYGSALSEEKLWTQAEQAFRHVVALNPTYSAGNAGLGIALAQQGKFEEARPYMANVVKYEPSDKQKGGYLAAFAALLAASGDHSGAAEFYRQASDFDPQNNGFTGALIGQFVAAHDCTGLAGWLAARSAQGIPIAGVQVCKP